MIQVRITKSQEKILSIDVKGHANSAAYGSDLVCAEVSAIMIGLCNALNEAKLSCDITFKENHITLETDGKSQKCQHMLYTGMIQLETVYETNKEYINIKFLEVSK